MEARQDTTENELRNLTASVIRVEQNQVHATDLNKLRFDALQAGIEQVGSTLTEFVKRMDSLLTGETQTTQTRQLMTEYTEFVKEVKDHIKESNAVHAAAAGRSEGVVFALTGGKAIILTIAALAGPILAILALVSK